MTKRNYVADRVRTMPASGIRRFFDIVSQMEDVISLGVGEPDFVTPWRVREAAIYAIEKGFTTYTSNYGLLELREVIAERLLREHGVRYNPNNEVLVTVGVSEAIDLVMRAVLNPGDEVIIPEPCFVSYRPCVVFAGGVPVIITTRAENDFKPTVAEIEAAITPRTRAIFISYPSNPTGTALERPELEQIAVLAERHDLLVITDEIYEKLRYSGAHTCFSAIKGMRDRTVLLNGLSKAHAMTGWRVGYACASAEITEAMMKVHQFTMMCASIIAQKAALEALANGEPEMEEMVAEYGQRCRLIVGGLNEIGLPCFEPKGAFYAFPSIRETGLTSEEFAERLLFEEKVAVVPGNAFGECGEGYVRCAYATSTSQIEEALERMGRFVRKLSG